MTGDEELPERLGPFHAGGDRRVVDQVLRHRLRSHEAALAAAEALGYPAELADSVAATRARLAELHEIAADLEDARLEWAGTDEP